MTKPRILFSSYESTADLVAALDDMFSNSESSIDVKFPNNVTASIANIKNVEKGYWEIQLTHGAKEKSYVPLGKNNSTGTQGLCRFKIGEAAEVLESVWAYAISQRGESKGSQASL